MRPISQTHAIVLTPPGAAGIAVVRLHGPGVCGFLDAHFARPARAGRCVHGELRDRAGRVIDDPVVVLHQGEMAADINVHGGPRVVAEVLELARAAGMVLVRWQEDQPLPEAAVDAEDALEREMLAYLPLARTRETLALLLAQPTEWRTLPREGPADLRPMLDDRGLWWALRTPRVAIVGPPNVGKSTLANRLFGQERSITADLPGTTRDWVGAEADLNGLLVRLVDTPGLRETHDPIELAAIAGSAAVVRAADLVVVVNDATRPAAECAELRERYPGAIFVLNKADLPGAHGYESDAIRTVATTGEGVDELRLRIRTRFDCASFAPRACWWTPRQRAMLEMAGRGFGGWGFGFGKGAGAWR